MNDWRTILALVLVLYILFAYMIEVILGSRPGLYNAELGKDAGCGKRTRLSNREFFFRYLPIMLGIAGSLLLIAQVSKQTG
jgi:hypothetical protein